METVLYVGAPHPEGDPLGLLTAPTGSATAETRRLEDGSILFIRRGRPPFRHERRLFAVSDVAAAAAFLRQRPVDALVIDTRDRPFLDVAGASEDGEFDDTRAGRLLARLFPEVATAGAFQRDRVIAIVGTGSRGVDTAYRLGAYRVGGVLSAPSLDGLLGRIDGLLGRRAGGRIALCLAGGGIEGLIYEIGVMRAIEWFLADRPLVDIDLFCGISAGSMLGAFLANGIGPDEIARGLSGESARIDPIRRNDIFDPNFKELGQRGFRLARDLARGGSGPRGIVSSLMRAVPSAAFAGDRMRAYIERQLTKPGMANEFDRLRRPLYVGATDQDTSQAVVFGGEGYKHVPVHRAVRASSALVPFYAPEKIDGRYYIDGSFSRTTNMRVAVTNGATLVLLIDPLVPATSEDPGYVHERGGVYSTVQGVKGLINGRFDKAVRAIRELHPEVAFYLFRPEGREMKILSGSPMKYFYRREIEEIAFDSTVAKIRALLPDMQRDFALHGVTLRDPEVAVSMPPPPRFEPSAIGIS